MYLSRRYRSFDIWPGFVDALGSLLNVVIFVVLMLAIGQFFLTDALSGRNRALADLNKQVASLADLLSLEQAKTESLSEQAGELRAQLSQLEATLSQVQASLTSKEETIKAQIANVATLQADIEALRKLRDQLQQEAAQMISQLKSRESDLVSQQQISAEALTKVEMLNRQINELREQLTALYETLESAHQDVKEKDAKIKDLGEKLNIALAERAQKLAKYRSEFFGRLREVLSEYPDIKIVGDRFVFPSELLFDTASATLEVEGREQVKKLVITLNEISPRIPGDIDWVLQIDGHTDRRPINTIQFPSNWELSTARALAIVKYMIELGVSPNHLVATGFGEYRPINAADTEAAWAQNRRIEIKLTAP